ELPAQRTTEAGHPTGHVTGDPSQDPAGQAAFDGLLACLGDDPADDPAARAPLEPAERPTDGLPGRAGDATAGPPPDNGRSQGVQDGGEHPGGRATGPGQ